VKASLPIFPKECAETKQELSNFALPYGITCNQSQRVPAATNFLEGDFRGPCCVEGDFQQFCRTHRLAIRKGRLIVPNPGKYSLIMVSELAAKGLSGG